MLKTISVIFVLATIVSAEDIEVRGESNNRFIGKLNMVRLMVTGTFPVTIAT